MPDGFSAKTESSCAKSYSVGPHLNFDHGTQECRGLLHLRHGNTTVKLFAFPVSGHDASRPQDSEVLGEIGFGNAGPCLQLCGPAVATLKHRNQPQSGWISEGLADRGLPFVITVIRARIFLHRNSTLDSRP